MESNPKRVTVPVSPVAPYLGGKRNLAKRLIPLIDGVEHKTYAEAFVGMGGVFLRRTIRPRSEVINDLNRDVANLFRILQRHYVPFVDMMRWQLTTRSEFERLVEVDPNTLTDLERAARFLYLQRTAFGGKISGKNFGVAIDRPARFDISKLIPLLEAVHERLSSVVIECMDYKQFLQRYDRKTTLFYLDPPYFGHEADYGVGMFASEDFTIMADRLAQLEGKFILSLNDVPAVREIFAAFFIMPVQTRYTIANGKQNKVAKELIISNTPLHE